MTLYPNVMRKAQAELDVVVGRERIPTFEDHANLPYVCALLEEVLRWRNPAPSGTSRSTDFNRRIASHSMPW